MNDEDKPVKLLPITMCYSCFYHECRELIEENGEYYRICLCKKSGKEFKMNVRMPIPDWCELGDA